MYTPIPNALKIYQILYVHLHTS